MPIATSGPVVRLSGIGPVDESVVGAVGMELIFEHDSEWSELGNSDAGEDPDSNSEGFYGNDYPEVMRQSRAVINIILWVRLLRWL